MEQKPPSEPKLAWMKEEEEDPGAAPAQQPGEEEQFQPLQEDAGTDQTQQQDPAHGHFHETAQMVCKFIKTVHEKETSDRDTKVIAFSDIFRSETSAALLDLLVEKGISSRKQVPAIVRYIHHWLKTNEPVEHRLDHTLLELTEAYITDVVVALLRAAPSCDRAASSMWRAIMSSPRAAEPAMLTLLDVLRSWPKYSTYTADGDNTDVFALAATVVMWKILQEEPCCPHILIELFPQLFVRLLFQAFFSTLDMPEEVDNLWKGCQEQHGLAINPNRLAVRTLKALLCLLQCEHVVLAMERMCGWDTLLCADTHYYAVAVLARELRTASVHLCCSISCCLLGMLSKETPYWDFPAMAFLGEVLHCMDLSDCGDSIMKLVSRHLLSERREMRRQALKVLHVVIDNPSMAKKMWRLIKNLVELLRDHDNDVVRMTIVILSCLVLDNATSISGSIALQLAEALQPLFDSDDSQVQQLSLFVFEALMTLVVKEGKTALKAQVRQSLLPLFFHCRDENQRVAKASREALLSATKFLRRRGLEKLVKKEKFWKFSECLLADDRSRAAEHLRQALPYLENPQEPLREEAIRFTGIAGRRLSGQQEEFQLLCKALEHMTEDISSAISNLALQTLYILRAVESPPPSTVQRLQDLLRRAWRTRPRLWGLGWLSCWGSANN